MYLLHLSPVCACVSICCVDLAFSLLFNWWNGFIHLCVSCVAGFLTLLIMCVLLCICFFIVSSFNSSHTAYNRYGTRQSEHSESITVQHTKRQSLFVCSLVACWTDNFDLSDLGCVCMLEFHTSWCCAACLDRCQLNCSFFSFSVCCFEK